MSQDRLGTFNYTIHFSDSAKFFKKRLVLLKEIMMVLKRDAIKPSGKHVREMYTL